LILDKQGNLWVGTVDKGLNFIQYSELHKDNVYFDLIQRKPHYTNGLISNLIYSLYVSNDNNLWIGTIGSGVNIYNPNQKKFSHIKFPENTADSTYSNFIRSVYADNQDIIWVGTHNNGLFLINIKNEEIRKLGFDTQSIFYIAQFNNKKLICTAKGLYLAELINNRFIIHDHFTTGNSAAFFYILNSKANIFWIATLHGLIRAEIINNKIINDQLYTSATTPHISTNNCRVLLYDEIENELLVGTEGGGLNIITLNENHYPEKVKIFNNPKDSSSISNNYIRSIIKDKNQNIWIGTYEGLNKIIRDSQTDEISFKSFTTKNGLPNNMIQFIAEDNYHSLWIGTNGGLSQFNPIEEKFINYTVSDGIQSNEFSEHCVFIKPEGEIITGGTNGLTVFYPEQIEINSQVSQTTITDFFMHNKKVAPLEKFGRKAPLQESILLTDTIVLLPNQDNIGFNFSAMIYPSAEKVQYAYKLEGFEDEWNYTDAKQRNANYTNLRNGDYIFKVKSTNNDGIWSEMPKEIYIHINKPFYITWFAFILYIIIIVLFALYFSYFSVIRYTTKKRLLLEQEHDKKIHELDILRTKFFINISHDLRTPLTLIREPLNSMLQNKNRSNEDLEKLNLIKRNVKRLNYLIEQLLDVRKAESGKLSASLKKEDIVTYTKEEVAHFKYAVKQKGLSIKIKNNPDVILAYFDRGMISKVYFNIISNAIKYTEKGEIIINIEKVKKDNYEILKNAPFETFVKIDVLDSGRGIPKDQKDKVFDRFYQGKTQSGNGYGIGLSHTKELIDAHQGYILLESTVNKGTNISFFLPEIEIDELKEEIVNKSMEDVFIDSESENKNEIETEKLSNSLKTILIVEDNLDMRKLIKSELKNEFNVLEASDGSEGLKQAEENLPDLIVSDVMMPNIGGIELCEKIKSNIETSHIPVILLTAKVDQETKYDGIKTGADDYIAKPFEMEYLLIRIKNILDSRDKLRKLFQKNYVFEPSAVTVTSLDEEFLKTLINEIEAGIPDSDFSISVLESKLNMSHANFYRKIKSLTGHSGQELLLNMRIKRAHQIMSKNSNIRISEVAYMVGFQNPNYFGKCFKKTYGMTPSKFLKHNNN